jgi:hypothetical protein
MRDDEYANRNQAHLERLSASTGLCVCFLTSKAWRGNPNCLRCSGEGVLEMPNQWRPFEPCKENAEQGEVE